MAQHNKAVTVNTEEKALISTPVKIGNENGCSPIFVGVAMLCRRLSYAQLN